LWGAVFRWCWAADRLFRAGIRDAHLRYHLVACPLAGALAALAYVVDDAWLTVLLFNLGLFCLMGYPGIGAASLQIATPAPVRGKASAVYLMVLNLVGALLGPLIVAAITDYGFADERALGRSMSIFALGAMAIATVLFASALGAMRDALRSEAGSP
jgi:MFS family permease